MTRIWKRVLACAVGVLVLGIVLLSVYSQQLSRGRQQFFAHVCAAQIAEVIDGAKMPSAISIQIPISPKDARFRGRISEEKISALNKRLRPGEYVILRYTVSTDTMVVVVDERNSTVISDEPMKRL